MRNSTRRRLLLPTQLLRSGYEIAEPHRRIVQDKLLYIFILLEFTKKLLCSNSEIAIDKQRDKHREMSKNDEPVMGVPYYTAQNPYQAGAIPPNAVFGDPKGIPIQQTIYRDTPAPFNCVYCGNSGVTTVR